MLCHDVQFSLPDIALLHKRLCVQRNKLHRTQQASVDCVRKLLIEEPIKHLSCPYSLRRQRAARSSHSYVRFRLSNSLRTSGLWRKLIKTRFQVNCKGKYVAWFCSLSSFEHTIEVDHSRFIPLESCLAI